MGTSTARLEVVAGNAAGTSIVVEDELVIGRHAEGVGRLADDEEISRAHARVTVDASSFCAIEDLSSTNGTFVNGLRISAPQTLSEGDTIELGGTTLLVREVPGMEAPAPAAPDDSPQPTVVTREETPGPRTTDTEAAAEPAPPAEAEPIAQEPFAEPAVAATAPDVAPEPAAVAAEPAQAAPPKLELRLEVDFTTHEAHVFLSGSSEPVRLVWDGDAWRPAPST
jgi:predicted component of type VI protein secretion system